MSLDKGLLDAIVREGALEEAHIREEAAREIEEILGQAREKGEAIRNGGGVTTLAQTSDEGWVEATMKLATEYERTLGRIGARALEKINALSVEDKVSLLATYLEAAFAGLPKGEYFLKAPPEIVAKAKEREGFEFVGVETSELDVAIVSADGKRSVEWTFERLIEAQIGDWKRRFGAKIMGDKF